jgi:lipopolysaccharide biosynthesis protein
MVRALAFYLPQFHPIPENDAWWGKGFTEWTNTAKAQPLFQGHYQPHIPADLGFYDLRVPETRAAQAGLARQYGIEGFCYYHFWFGGGQRLLELVFDEVLASGEPDFPFCLCWANQSWTGLWYGSPETVLMQQTYPGEDDHRAHFAWLLRAFQDPRYIRVHGRPLLLVFEPFELPDAPVVCALWRQLAEQAGLPGLHLLAVRHQMDQRNPQLLGFDGVVDNRIPLTTADYFSGRQPFLVLDHRELVQYEVPAREAGVVKYPCIGPNWDNSPRLGQRGLVYVNSSPELFEGTVRGAVALLSDRPPEERLLFLKAWNEWAEGNHLEPDLKYGHGWLRALQQGMAADNDLALKP